MCAGPSGAYTVSEVAGGTPRAHKAGPEGRPDAGTPPVAPPEAAADEGNAYDPEKGLADEDLGQGNPMLEDLAPPPPPPGSPPRAAPAAAGGGGSGGINWASIKVGPQFSPRFHESMFHVSCLPSM
jgi:hypothetical protein